MPLSRGVEDGKRYSNKKATRKISTAFSIDLCTLRLIFVKKKKQKRNTSHRYMRFSPFVLPQPRASRDIYISNLENLLAISFDWAIQYTKWHEIKCTQEKGQRVSYDIRGNCRVYITMPRMDSTRNVTIHLKYIFAPFQDLFNLIKISFRLFIITWGRLSRA